MKYILTSEQMKSCDRYNIASFISSIDLMELAGKRCFEAIKPYIKKDSKILIVAGSGGNGGDGYVIARYAQEENYDVDVITFDKDIVLKEDHVWGKFFVHYNDEYYTNFMKKFDRIVEFYELKSEIDELSAEVSFLKSKFDGINSNFDQNMPNGFIIISDAK